MSLHIRRQTGLLFRRGLNRGIWESFATNLNKFGNGHANANVHEKGLRLHVRGALGDAKGGLPLKLWHAGAPADKRGRRDSPWLHIAKKKGSAGESPFRAGGLCSAHPLAEHSLFRSEMKPAGRGGAAHEVARNIPDVYIS
jgi:hypothetical protein